jgi:hypothetical protein
LLHAAEVVKLTRVSRSPLLDGSHSRASSTPMHTAFALQAFRRGAFELAASELERCRVDEAPLTQLRIASEMASIARTTLDLGELLVRLELTDPRAPAAALGQALLDQLEGTLTRLGERASLPSDDETESVDAAAPPEPNATPEEIEHFLASRVSPTDSVLRAPFGGSGRELHLVERNRHGYDIWWGGWFFAIPHGRSPYLAFHLIRLLEGTRREVRSWISRGIRLPQAGGTILRRVRRLTLRRVLARVLSRLRTLQSVAPDRSARVLHVPLLRLSATRTGLEMQQHIADRLSKAPRGG